MPGKNKGKNNRGIHVLTLALLLALMLGAVFFFFRQRRALHTELDIENGPNNVYGRTLVVTADEDYDPYCFYDENGEPCGHDIELIYLLADRMGYNVEIRLLPWSSALAAVESGEADVVLTVAWLPEAYPELELSVPLVNDPFVAFGKAAYSQIGQLYDSRLAVLAGTGCVPGFIDPYRLNANATYYRSTSEAFAAVAAGEQDYVISRYSVGRRAMANMEDSDIQAVGPTLLNNYICIGVPKGRGQLLTELDDAIIALSSDGTIAGLSGKWLGQYVQTLTPREFMSQNAERLALVAGAMLLLFLVGFILVTGAVTAKEETALKRLAERDQLTGLYNRVTCEGMIRQTLSSSHAETDFHALLVIDMDNFKLVNDSFGHMEGDAALKRLAAGLQRMFRTGDIVGRLGGDEFFVFMPGCTDAGAAAKKAQQVCGISQETYSLDGGTLKLSASVGMATYPAQGTDFLSLYKYADEALYEAKRRGKRGCAFYGADGALVYRSC